MSAKGVQPPHTLFGDVTAEGVAIPDTLPMLHPRARHRVSRTEVAAAMPDQLVTALCGFTGRASGFRFTSRGRAGVRTSAYPCARCQWLWERLPE